MQTPDLDHQNAACGPTHHPPTQLVQDSMHLDDFRLAVFSPEGLGRRGAAHRHKAVGFALYSGSQEVAAGWRRHGRCHMTGGASTEARAALLTQAELQHRLVWVLPVSWRA